MKKRKKKSGNKKPKRIQVVLTDFIDPRDQSVVESFGDAGVPET